MTTATRASKLRYEVRFGSFVIGSGNDRDEAEAVRDKHAERTGQPLTAYIICPVLRKEKE